MTHSRDNVAFCCQLCCQQNNGRRFDSYKASLQAGSAYGRQDKGFESLHRHNSSYEVYGRLSPLKNLSQILPISLKIYSCLSVFLSTFLSGCAAETAFEKAIEAAPLQLADKREACNE